jgi:hypothetical protein
VTEPVRARAGVHKREGASASKCEQAGQEPSKSNYSNSRASPSLPPYLFIYSLSKYERQPSHGIPPLLFFVKYFNNVIIIVIIIIIIPRVSGIPQVSSDTTQITVRYVPIPVTGMVFAGTGTVWEIPTRGIPVTNPRQKQKCPKSC